MEPTLFALALLMVFAQIYIQGLCYKVMTHKFDMRFNTLQGFGYCSIDLFFSQITPFAVGGQPIMIYEMSKRDYPASKTTTMVLLYSFLNKLALIDSNNKLSNISQQEDSNIIPIAQKILYNAQHFDEIFSGLENLKKVHFNAIIEIKNTK